MNEVKTDFPPVFVEYAREKLKNDRALVEYLSKFGTSVTKNMAQMVLAAAGEGDKSGE